MQTLAGPPQQRSGMVSGGPGAGMEWDILVFSIGPALGPSWEGWEESPAQLLGKQASPFPYPQLLGDGLVRRAWWRQAQPGGSCQLRRRLASCRGSPLLSPSLS